MQKIGIIGLGYVGLTLSVALAKSGEVQVYGIEKSDETRRKLEQGKAHFFETGLNEALASVRTSGQLEILSSISELPPVETIIVTVGTPLDQVTRRFSTEALFSVADDLGNHLEGHELVVLRSTVSVGTTDTFAEILRNRIGKKIDYAFCPERTVEGYAMMELRSLPQIVGAVTPRVHARAASVFSVLTSTVVKVEDPKTAELIKLYDNAQRDVWFAYANEVALVCDELSINAYEVIEKGGLGYSRSNLARPGLVGGPCLSKDPHILVQSLTKLDGKENSSTSPVITQTARLLNEDLVPRIISRILEFRSIPSKICLMGVAFKGVPITDDLRGSPIWEMLDQLKARLPFVKLAIHDYYCDPAAFNSYEVSVSKNIKAATDGADVVCFLNNLAAYESISIDELALGISSGGLIYDVWSRFGRARQLSNEVKYIGLGNLN